MLAQSMTESEIAKNLNVDQSTGPSSREAIYRFKKRILCESF